MKICCFTGHRTLPREHTPALISALDALLSSLYARGFRIFRTGGAKGFDTLAALRVLTMRERLPDIQLHLLLPCPDQHKAWSMGEQALFEEIRDKANAVRVLSPTYTPSCMHARNRALVDGSDLCVAYLTANRGGTLYTCSYALKTGVELLNLYDTLHAQ